MDYARSFAFYLEIAGVGLALLYVLLAIRELRSCWILAIFSSLVYIPVFYSAKLYMESVLQLFFVIIAFIGWYRWKDKQSNAELKITKFSIAQHLRTAVIYLLFSVLLGNILKNYTDASFPYLDSAVTSFSIAASFMQTKKIIENWIYWIVIDALAIYIYIMKQLYMTAGLYAVYLLLAVVGYAEWRKLYKKSES